MDLNKFSSVPGDPKILFGNIFNTWIKGEKLTFTDCCDEKCIKAWLLFSVLSDCSFGQHARRFQRVKAILITALKKTVISTRQEPRNPLDWLESTCASVRTLRTNAGQKKTTSRKGGQRSGRGRAGAWKCLDGELHNSSMRKKKNTPKHTRWAWIHICPSRAKFSPISWADPSWLILSMTYGYHNQMSADKRKHSCSHGNRGFWDIMMSRMDKGWANKQFKVKLNFSTVALHILFSQFLHATNLIDVLLTCVFGFTLEQIKIKKKKTQTSMDMLYSGKNHFSLLLSFF